jgi:hypothetical protein
MLVESKSEDATRRQVIAVRNCAGKKRKKKTKY